MCSTKTLIYKSVKECASTMVPCVAEIPGVSSVTLEMGKPTHGLLSLCFSLLPPSVVSLKPKGFSGY